MRVRKLAKVLAIGLAISGAPQVQANTSEGKQAQVFAQAAQESSTTTRSRKEQIYEKIKKERESITEVSVEILEVVSRINYGKSTGTINEEEYGNLTREIKKLLQHSARVMELINEIWKYGEFPNMHDLYKLDELVQLKSTFDQLAEELQEEYKEPLQRILGKDRVEGFVSFLKIHSEKLDELIYHTSNQNLLDRYDKIEDVWGINENDENYYRGIGK